MDGAHYTLTFSLSHLLVHEGQDSYIVVEGSQDGG